MSTAVMHSGRFGGVQELRFEIAKSSDMGCATLIEGRFDDVPESCFQCAKNFEYGQQIYRVAISQKSCFRGAKYSSCKMFDLLVYRNPVFRVRNVQIWAVLSNI